MCFHIFNFERRTSCVNILFVFAQYIITFELALINHFNIILTDPIQAKVI